MSEPLFSAEEYIQFTQHENPHVRRWALEWLVKRHPEAAKERAVMLLDDSGWGIAEEAADALAQLNAAEHAPLLLERFQQAANERRVRFLQAMGRLRYEPLLLVV